MPRADVLPPSGRVSDSIASAIKTDISTGVLIPGERLPAERDLAQKFKTSRLSVREAYRSLEEMGLLTIKRGAGGGAFIAQMDHQPVARSLSLMMKLGRVSHDEVTEARLLIEPPMARLAAQRATPEDIELLEGVLHQQERDLEKRGEYRRLDFHRLLARCAGNAPLEILMNSLADLTIEPIKHLTASQALKEHNLLFHQKIVDAMKVRDDDAVYELMLLHVGEVQSRLRDDLLEKARAARRTPVKRTRVRR